MNSKGSQKVKPKSQSSKKPHKDAAEQIAVVALNYLASDPEHLGGFLAATGIGPHNLRDAAREPHFLAGVLRYLMQDESLLLAFAANAGFTPEMVVQADVVLSPENYGFQ
jgi:hypothetical protein